MVKVAQEVTLGIPYIFIREGNFWVNKYVSAYGG